MRKLLGLTLSFLLLVSQMWAQTKEVSGKVTDAKDGSPLVGATIKVKGSSRATTTATDGSFKISFTGNSAILQVSSVGFEQKEIAVTGGEISVSLEVSTTSLNEVFVVGYGTKIKRDITGSVTKVGAKELNNTPVTSFESALQGRAAGVQITQQNGKLGQGINIRIRGSASVSAGNEPLYVVDGIPLITTNLSSNGAQTNPLTDINTNDIESIEILKDASAAAIYGSRASNGVVLITTKRGKAGKSKIEFGYMTGLQTPTNKMEFMNAQEYVEYTRLAAAAAKRIDPSFDYVAFNEGRLQRYSAGNTDYQTYKVNTDWQEEAFQRAPISQYDLNFSGGNDRTTFYMGGQFLDQTGIIVRNSFKRYNGRINVDQKLNSWLNVGMNMSFARSQNNRVSNDNAFSTPLQIVALSPITPLIDPRTGLTSGALDLATGRPNTNFPVYYNPILSVENAKYTTLTNRTLGNFYGNVTIAKGLVFRSEFGIDQLNQNEESYNGKLTARNLGVPSGAGFNSTDQILNYNTNNFLRYFNTFNEKHDVDVVAGMSFQEYKLTSNSASGEQFPSDAFKKIASAASKTDAQSSETQFAFLSYFARANYKFNDRYLLALSGRYDGSSRFGANNRYGFFPAASVGWILSEENFMQSIKWVSFLKLKASYGLTGNAEIGNFASRGLFSGDAGYGAIPGTRPTQLANPNLKWETTASTDIGIETGLFNNRLVIEADVYLRNTKDLLLSVEVPGTSGFASQIQNKGKLENKGIEFTITSENFVTKNFKWSTSVNFGLNRNKITDLAGQELGTGQNRAREGQPLGVFVAREFAGADPATGDAIYYVNTLKADGTRDRTTTNDYNAAEEVVIGNPNPKFIYGMRNTLSYKGLDLEVLLQGVYGNNLYYGGGQYMSASGSNGYDNQTRDQLNSWKKAGDITNVPEARLFLANGVDPSSRYIADGSFLRVKSVTLGYNLPQSITSKIKIERARVYFRAQNLFTFTKYGGWDPEVNADYQVSNINQGVDFYSAPQIKAIVFGINIGL
ncbi:TonB-dependent receptor [Lacibacter sp.]|uniref:SusC/RagA family TonB-linked outer membrane protein n=1 Tax=Lacibacter sp. TaxID=1915409 RepID=UPI002B4B71EF|nr:TonB-dependent receptor [Lacibacter sp.]HLP36155.1 TonB-dependent receptor [Lacibacter sp.]